MKSQSHLLKLAPVLWLAGCFAGGPPPAAVPRAPEVPPAQRMAEIDAIAGIDDTELNVQPLRDPQVEDLRHDEVAARAAGDLDKARDALNTALLMVPDDPALLQERAEIALLQGEYARAETLAMRAVELGSAIGPICRRHWATIEQARLARGETGNAVSARAMIGGCTVPSVIRM
ncbi:MAG: hypothetical protein LBL59_09260 [Xanthomonadaceae bacterium]|nr:hypothetical protein [Xanthomonadaceae bacterium]